MKILCIAGPTASGKTAFSLEVAHFLKNHDLQVNIINVDSCQLYKDFPIITAQPSKEEFSKAEHSLYGILDMYEKSNAGMWLKLANDEINKSISQNKIPVLVGGTGMYFKTLLDGIIQIPTISKEITSSLEKDFNDLGIDYLYKKLQVVDEEFSNKIHKNDRQRIIRALEVYEQTNKTLSVWHHEHQANIEKNRKYKALQIGIGMPLDELTPYLYKRTGIMLENNALDEVRSALDKSSNMQSPAFLSIGCKELGRYIQGEISLDEATDEWNKNTRAYAKRQWTWFRKDKNIEWCHPLDNSRKNEILKMIENFIL